MIQENLAHLSSILAVNILICPDHYGMCEAVSAIAVGK